MAETLAEIIEEHDRREALMAEMLPGEVKADEWRARDAFARRHFARLVAVAKAAVALFAALDHVTPDWREKTCIIDEDSDEVNVAWGGLELALEHESSTPEQIEHALRAAVRGEGKGGAE